MSMFDYRMIIEGQSNNNEAGKRGWLFGAGVAAVVVVRCCVWHWRRMASLA